MFNSDFKSAIYTFSIYCFFAFLSLENCFAVDLKEKQWSGIDTLLLQADNVNIGADRILKLSQEALALSLQKGYLKGQLHASYNIGRAKFYQGHLKDAFYVFDSLLNRMSVDSVAISKSVNYNLTRSKLTSMLAIIFQELDDPTTSMQYYFKALELIDDSKNYYDIALIYKGLGCLNMNAGNEPKAQEYFNKAIKLSETTGDFKIRFDICNEQFAHYRSKKDFHKALELAVKLQNLAQQDKMPYMNAIALKNMGEIYFFLKQYSIASSYLKNVIENKEYSTFYNVLAECFTLLANIEKKNKQFSLAEVYATRALDYSNKTSDISVKAGALLELAGIQNETGKYADAFKNLNLHLRYKDSVNETQNAHQVLILQSKYDLDKAVNDKRLVENKLTIETLRNSKKNYLLIASFIIILLMGILIVLQIRKHRFEKKMSFEIEQQKSVIRKQEEMIMLEKEENLKLELEHKNRELVSRALTVTKNQEETRTFIDELKTLRDKPGLNPESFYIVDNLIKQLSKTLNNDSWEDFRVYFENVYSDFYTNLSSAYPNLTPHELKICAYLKLNLSTKDIASLTCREVRSIESTRNRLRKHLDLQPDVNLTLFLSKF